MAKIRIFIKKFLGLVIIGLFPLLAHAQVWRNGELHISLDFSC